MKSIKESHLYSQVLKEFNYDFADVFVFNNIVVSEIKADVILTWDNHAKLIAKDVFAFLGSDGSDIIYISNRIHSYNVVATDWLKFFKNNYSLKAYYVVGNQKHSFINTLFENLFCKSTIKEFTSIEVALEMARETQYELVSI